MSNHRKQKKGKPQNKLSLEEYLKQLPPPPPEHAYELALEKRVKKLVETHASKTN